MQLLSTSQNRRHIPRSSRRLFANTFGKSSLDRALEKKAMEEIMRQALAPKADATAARLMQVLISALCVALLACRELPFFRVICEISFCAGARCRMIPV
jgi:hypothetical protein